MEHVGRIAIVEDDLYVLKALRALLRRRGSRWEVVSFLRAEDAIQEMSAHPFDVVVSDAEMPGMNGVSLLRRVRDEHPDTVRIMLSGSTGTPLAMASVPLAHQFLSKPWDNRDVIATLERAFELRALLGPHLRRLVGRVPSLPSAPAVYQRFAAALERATASLNELAGIIEEDPGLASRLLHVANSAFFSPRVRLVSVEQAVRHLGVDLVRNLTLVAEVFRRFEGPLPAGVSVSEAQGHALLTGRLAAEMAPASLREEAFMAGLLHDVGTLILAEGLAAEVTHIRRRAHDEGRPVHAVERDVLGTSHAEVGAYLLGLWGLAPEVVCATAWHHCPSRAQGDSGVVTGIVHIASALASEVQGRPGNLDESYVQAAGHSDMLPHWREVVARLAHPGWPA